MSYYNVNDIYIVSDGKDLVINWGETTSLIIKNVLIKHMDSRMSMETYEKEEWGIKSPGPAILLPGPKIFEVTLTLTGSEYITSDKCFDLKIANIYNMSIFEIMKIINERLENE